MSSGKHILILSLVLALCVSKLIVYSPEKLKTQIDDSKDSLISDGYIETSVANFGLIPYGHSIVGNLYFDPNNADGCGRFASLGNSEAS